MNCSPPLADVQPGAHHRRQWVVRLIRHSVVPVLANDRTSDRSHLRSSIASAVQSPFLKFPFLAPRGAPGLNPPCRRHRLRPRMAGRWHGVPARVLAPHFGARLRSPSLVSSSFMGLISKLTDPPGGERSVEAGSRPMSCSTAHTRGQPGACSKCRMCRKYRAHGVSALSALSALEANSVGLTSHRWIGRPSV